MFYLSTRDAAKSKRYSFEDAVMAGYADDGGVCVRPDIARYLCKRAFYLL